MRQNAGVPELPIRIDDVASAVLSKLAQPTVNTKAPRTQQEVGALLATRPPAWPHLLFAGVLFQGVHVLESKFRDHVAGYAPRNGAIVDGLSLDAFRRHHALLSEIIDSVEKILSPETRRATFGTPGNTENLNPDDIIHTAQRLVGLYNELLDWARGVRGTTYLCEEVRRVADLQARYADNPVAAVRKLAADFLMLADTLVDRLTSGENVTYEFTLPFRIDPQLSAALDDAVEQVKQRW